MKRLLMIGALLIPATAALAGGDPAPGRQPEAAAVAATAPFGEAARMSGADLGAVTGREDTNMMVRAQNTSTVSNNSVSGQSQTGTISFDAQSFGNMAGLSLLSANTGNNVSINSSLNVNVAIRP